MPLKFWDEAIATVVYLINRTRSKILDFSTPLERLFNKKKVYYLFLKTFGCACWSNLRPYNDHKLAFRSKCCVFLGYSFMHKGYKCLKVYSGRVYISRDVIFDEKIFSFTELHSNVGDRLPAEINLLLIHLLPSSSVDPRGTNFTSDQTLQNNLAPVPNSEDSRVYGCHLQEIEGEQEGNPTKTEFELDSVSEAAVISDTTGELASGSVRQTTVVGDESTMGSEPTD
jgi:hypothetical protein